ncbi:MAG: aldehyde dehydrogenase family protein [Phycisphaerales bacterium]
MTPADLVGGEWLGLRARGGLSGAAAPARAVAGITSRNPAHPDRIVWSGTPDSSHIDAAVSAARAALPTWSRWPRERRFAALLRLKALYESRAQQIAELISDETGKVLWDARQEAGALAAKIDITLDDSAAGPLRRVTGFEFPLPGATGGLPASAPTRLGRCWFRPHGVMAVIGPFNFPAHLPNGHIIPALAMGNTVILKPSDKAPAVGQLLIALMQEALEAEGAPPGVVNLIQGAGDIAARLTTHAGIDGILFTGSWPVGRRILEANLDNPGRIVALEMGGNNPAVVLPDADLRQAVIECLRSAFVSTGQRCTCTRRVIIHEAIAARFIPALCKAASHLIIGHPRAEHPVFMGPIISEASRTAVLDFQSRAAAAGAEVLVEASQPNRPLPSFDSSASAPSALSAVNPPSDPQPEGWYISPGILRVDRFIPGDESNASAGEGFTVPTNGFHPGGDLEVFGPLLRLSVVPDLDEALNQANATRFGLAASIFTRDPAAVDRFLAEARAGCINVNTGTAGASSKLPFGGLGRSGNHRPAGSFSLDYCAYPVAGMIESGAAAQLTPGMHFDDAWL